MRNNEIEVMRKGDEKLKSIWGKDRENVKVKRIKGDIVENDGGKMKRIGGIERSWIEIKKRIWNEIGGNRLRKELDLIEKGIERERGIDEINKRNVSDGWKMNREMVI